MNLPESYAVWQPPVENQKGADSCAAQSFCNVYECIEYKRTGKHRNYSVGFMHGNPLNTAKRGMYLDDGVKILLEFGNVYRDVWECEFGGDLCKTLWMTQVTEEITNQAKKLIRGYVRLNTQKERQEYIYQYGLPIVIVADAIHFGIDGGTHAVACYGWDTDGNMLYTNSYGTAYGEGGRGKIADEYINEAIGLIPIDEGANMEQITLKDIAGRWSEAAIEREINRGTIKGYEDGTFKPTQPITREEAAVMFDRSHTATDKKLDDILKKLEAIERMI